MFSRFLKVATAMPHLMNKFYNGRFAPEFSDSMLKETIALVRDYISEMRIKSKTSEKIYMKTKYENFLQ